MLISRDREKLLEAIKYFAKKTKYCGLTKLFKLLNYLDFIHFRQTGRSVTGLTYHVYPRGPVPRVLHEEIRAAKTLDGKIDIQTYDEVETGAGGPYAPAKIAFKGRFNAHLFSKRELRIMEELAFVFNEATAEQMSEVSHLKGKPWDVTKRTAGMWAPIDYMLSLDGTDKDQLSAEEITERVTVREDARKAFS